MSKTSRPSLAAVILAAGQGTRMKSNLVKVLHPVAGRSMIWHVIEAVREAGADRIIIVVGHQQDRVRDALALENGVEFALQEEQLGTGHALECAADTLAGFDGDVLVCCGDTPLLRGPTLRRVVAHRRATDTVATLLTAEMRDPTGYGRVVMDEAGFVQRIVEERDADDEIRRIRCINTGVYCFDWSTARPLLDRLTHENAQGERYLTDVMSLLAADGTPGSATAVGDPQELTGINDRVQLAVADGVLRERIRKHLMIDGVTFLAPETTLIDPGVAIGPDTVVYPGVIIEGASSIGGESVIGPYCRLVDAHIGHGVELQGWNHIVRTTVPPGSIVKPHVRQGIE